MLKYLEHNPLDILFLDIDMPDSGGFELAKILCRDYRDLLIVFVSAYDNFVYESFECSPFAYMQKEFIGRDIKKVASRIREKLLAPTHYILLSTNESEIKVNVEDILFFESRKNYYAAYLVGGNVCTCRGTISGLEKTMSGYPFFKTHSAYLVNLAHAERITNDGYLQIGNKTVPIAQKRMKDFKKSFFEFSGRSLGM